MSLIDEVRLSREELASVLSNPDYGIRSMVEELYPDRAHFIYELLQNAEDRKAKSASFTLENDFLEFEHDGEPFKPENVWAITNIGKSTSADKVDKIGRFGVGFKAVFAYSETPLIWSPTYSFKITDLVLPTEIPRVPELGLNTRFRFPFNNPKKKPADAKLEIKMGLDELAETTLLFLSHLESITWRADGVRTEVLRILHSANHIELLKETGGAPTSSSHFLSFSRQVDKLIGHNVSVAFSLKQLSGNDNLIPNLPLSDQMKVVAANPGRVSVYFPAEKESSNLRFHLHAPFVTGVDRSSIKDTSANEPLYKLLADLTAESLVAIRDAGLLTTEFLAVLPNSNDPIPKPYSKIRDTVTEAMRNEPLTPVYGGGHAPAKQLLQAEGAAMQELLFSQDLEFLIDYDDDPPRWAANASQRNQAADRFLKDLLISKWDIPQLIETLHTICRSASKNRMIEWLKDKPVEWHQQFYATLQTYLSGYDPRLYKTQLLSALPIIRLVDGSYAKGVDCYYPTEGIESDEQLPRVDEHVYSSGKSTNEKGNAKQFLDSVGVRVVGDEEVAEVILKKRYATPEGEEVNENVHHRDMRLFAKVAEKTLNPREMFAQYFVFKNENGKMARPSKVYLDAPFLETGLCVYFSALRKRISNDNAASDSSRVSLKESTVIINRLAGYYKHKISNMYQKDPVLKSGLAGFAEKIGVQTSLTITHVPCSGNPEWNWFLSNAKGYHRDTGTNEDWIIPCLSEILNLKDEALSQLVWKTLCQRRDNKWLNASYNKNSTKELLKRPSQLVCLLRDTAWVPQAPDTFVKPAQAITEKLPDGFRFDSSSQWLKAVGFGEDEQKNSNQQVQKKSAAKELNFEDEKEAEEARYIYRVMSEDERVKYRSRSVETARELPEQESKNPARRADIVGRNAAEATERMYERRPRSVLVGSASVKAEAKQYLTSQYTNGDEVMFCQICQKPLPFKLDDGSYYFEVTRFLELQKEHHQNYLALCPLHNAMYTHVNRSKDVLVQMLMQAHGAPVKVVLASEPFSIYFTKTHLADLQSVLKVELG